MPENEICQRLGLDDAQKIAFKHPGHVLVTACPGSGKTRVLVARLALATAKLSPSRGFVIGITFTNRAADEIACRVDELGIETKKLWVGTVHAFCRRWIVAPYAGYIPELRHGFQFLDDQTMLELVTAMRTKYNLKSLSTKLDRDGNPVCPVEHRAAFAEYRDELRKRRAIDYDDILFYSYRLLRENKWVASTLSKLFTSISVDEYQDLHDLQYAILGCIVQAGGGDPPVFFVGDPNQSIYEGLGGKAWSDREISSEFGGPPVTPLSLSGCYRSTSRLTSYYANFQVQKENVFARGANANESGSISYHTGHDDERALYDTIANRIRGYLAVGIAPADICVLAPQWYHVTNCARALRILLPDIAMDAPGLSPFARLAKNCFYPAAQLVLTTPHSTRYGRRRRWVGSFIEQLESLSGQSSLLDDRAVLRLINSVETVETDAVAHVKRVLLLLTESMGINLAGPQISNQWSEFFETARRFYEKHDDVPSDLASIRAISEDRKGLVIGTCHGVKGEEYEAVIAFGFVLGLIPHWDNFFSKDDPKGTYASKRLIYVVASRAKKHLLLISENFRRNRKKEVNPPTESLKCVKYVYDH